MTDESISAVWASEGPMAKEEVMLAVHAALEEGRATWRRELGVRLASVAALVVLCPALLWCAAYGKSPLVRGGYALMALGTGVVIFAEWMYLSWSRQAFPGPIDARSQLQNSALMLFRQSTLIRTAGLWCAPIFIGTAFIATWLYQQRGHMAGYLLWITVLAAWCVSVVAGRSKSAQLDGRRTRVEELLASLRER
jgi:hypothetical protein